MTAPCPKCSSEHVYQDGNLWVCPECAHEWVAPEAGAEDVQSAGNDDACRDANGQLLTDGDSVVLIKDLKIKGASGTLKSGTKIKSIRIIDPIDNHNISCRVDGFGSLNLKSEFVRKQ